MTPVFLHFADPAFPLGPEHPADEHGRALAESGAPAYPYSQEVAAPGPWPGTRRAAFETVDEAFEQAAHDLAFHGAEIAHLIDDSGTDALDRKALVKRAHELIDEHHEPLRSALPEREFRARVAAAKADAKRRAT